jgi:hypothetical protein
MFDVGIGEVFVILLVCLVVFGPERFPRDGPPGRSPDRPAPDPESALEQLKKEAGDELNLPDLRVGSLRAQARDYLRELMDIDAQMAELSTRAPAALCSPRRGAGTCAVRP